MASEEDRQHATTLLRETRKRLRLLEIRKVRQGDSADPSVDIEIAGSRVDVATLESLLEPEPSPAVQDVVRRYIADDYLLLFTQGVKFGSRLTAVEQQTEAITQQQSRANLWRLTITEDVQGLKSTQTKNDGDRKHGQRRNLILFVVMIVLLIVLTTRILTM